MIFFFILEFFHEINLPYWQTFNLMTLKNNVMNQNPNNKIIFFFFPSTKRTPRKLVSFSLTDKLEGMMLEEG